MRRAQSEPFRLRRASTGFRRGQNPRGLSGQQILAETLQWFSAKICSGSDGRRRSNRRGGRYSGRRPRAAKYGRGGNRHCRHDTSSLPRARWGCKKNSRGVRSGSGRKNGLSGTAAAGRFAAGAAEVGGWARISRCGFASLGLCGGCWAAAGMEPGSDQIRRGRRRQYFERFVDLVHAAAHFASQCFADRYDTNLAAKNFSARSRNMCGNEFDSTSRNMLITRSLVVPLLLSRACFGKEEFNRVVLGLFASFICFKWARACGRSDAGLVDWCCEECFSVFDPTALAMALTEIRSLPPDRVL